MSIRQKWTTEDDLDAIDFIYNSLRSSDLELRRAARTCLGKGIWVSYVAKYPTRGITWESAQSRFRKQILPRLHTYGLDDDKMKCLLLRLSLELSPRLKKSIENTYRVAINTTKKGEVLDIVDIKVDSSSSNDTVRISSTGSEATTTGLGSSDDVVPDTQAFNDNDMWSQSGSSSNIEVVREDYAPPTPEFDSEGSNFHMEEVIQEQDDYDMSPLEENESVTVAPPEDWYLPIGDFVRHPAVAPPAVTREIRSTIMAVPREEIILALCDVNSVNVAATIETNMLMDQSGPDDLGQNDEPSLVVPATADDSSSPNCLIDDSVVDEASTLNASQQDNGFSSDVTPPSIQLLLVPKPLEVPKDWLEEAKRQEMVKKLAFVLNGLGLLMSASEAIELTRDYEHAIAETSEDIVAYTANIEAIILDLLAKRETPLCLDAPPLAITMFEHLPNLQPSPLAHSLEWHAQLQPTDRRALLIECLDALKDTPKGIVARMYAYVSECERSLCDTCSSLEGYRRKMAQLRQTLAKTNGLYAATQK
ncbi:unnamed protein product, partial [Mesorhabditis spiculigera]